MKLLNVFPSLGFKLIVGRKEPASLLREQRSGTGRAAFISADQRVPQGIFRIIQEGHQLAVQRRYSSHGCQQVFSSQTASVTGHDLRTGTTSGAGVGSDLGVVHDQTDLIGLDACLTQGLMGGLQNAHKTAAKVLEATQKIVDKHQLTTLMITHNMRDAIHYGNRLIMMYNGHVVVDVSGEDKKRLTVEQLLSLFSQASGSDEVDDKLVLS